MITFRDVTEKRAAALAAENERRYREAEAQNRAKDNFLATLSHELRTPMTSILGWVQFLRSGDYSPDELREALHMIENSAQLQKRLIDDMLDVSRIILGKFQVELRPTHLSDIVDAAVSTRASRRRRARRAPDLGRRPTADDVVDADATRLAAGHRQHPLERDQVHAARQAGRPAPASASITSCRSAFTTKAKGSSRRFSRTFSSASARPTPPPKRSGLGLGLAIARHIIDLHHGDIRAESEGLGKGARFTVTLPVIEQSQVLGSDAMMSSRVRRLSEITKISQMEIEPGLNLRTSA